MTRTTQKSLEKILRVEPRGAVGLGRRGRIMLPLVVMAMLSPVAETSFAATVAYWRHEEGPAGQIIPDGDDTVLDSSGNGHHMKTFSSANPPFTAATYSPLVSPLPLRSGLPNDLSLDFGPNPAIGTEDGGGLNDDNFTDSKSINSQLFSAMTAELAFNMNAVSGFQALFGKDGAPINNSPVPPLKFLVRGDDFPNAIPNQLFIEWIDGDGDIHFLASGATVTTGNWNHVAFVLTANTAELYVRGETGPYTLVDSKADDFAGGAGEVLFDSDANYSVGRGAFGGGVADWSDALIDEVRVSDMALTPSEFLFVPEPNTILLAGVGMMGMWLCYRRRQGEEGCCLLIS